MFSHSGLVIIKQGRCPARKVGLAERGLQQSALLTCRTRERCLLPGFTPALRWQRPNILSQGSETFVVSAAIYYRKKLNLCWPFLRVRLKRGELSSASGPAKKGGEVFSGELISGVLSGIRQIALTGKKHRSWVRCPIFDSALVYILAIRPHNRGRLETVLACTKQIQVLYTYAYSACKISVFMKYNTSSFVFRFYLFQGLFRLSTISQRERSCR